MSRPIADIPKRRPRRQFTDEFKAGAVPFEQALGRPRDRAAEGQGAPVCPSIRWIPRGLRRACSRGAPTGLTRGEVSPSGPRLSPGDGQVDTIGQARFPGCWRLPLNLDDGCRESGGLVRAQLAAEFRVTLRLTLAVSVDTPLDNESQEHARKRVLGRMIADDPSQLVIGSAASQVQIVELNLTGRDQLLRVQLSVQLAERPHDVRDDEEDDNADDRGDRPANFGHLFTSLSGSSVTRSYVVAGAILALTDRSMTCDRRPPKRALQNTARGRFGKLALF